MDMSTDSDALTFLDHGPLYFFDVRSSRDDTPSTAGYSIPRSKDAVETGRHSAVPISSDALSRGPLNFYQDPGWDDIHRPLQAAFRDRWDIPSQWGNLSIIDTDGDARAHGPLHFHSRRTMHSHNIPPRQNQRSVSADHTGHANVPQYLQALGGSADTPVAFHSSSIGRPYIQQNTGSRQLPAQGVKYANRLIQRPFGPLSKPNAGGYSLKVTLGWDLQTYRLIQKRLRELCKQHLDLRFSYEVQRPDALARFRNEAKILFPILTQYEGEWPAEDFAKMYLKNRRQSSGLARLQF